MTGNTLGEQYILCNEMLNRIYKLTANINVRERKAVVVSCREAESLVGENIFLDLVLDTFDGLDSSAEEIIAGLLSESSLCEILEGEVVKKTCFKVQRKHNIYNKYVVSFYPVKHNESIYVTVADNEYTDNTITLMFKKNAVNIRLSDILYVDYGNHSVDVHSIQGMSSFFSVSFSDVADMLLKHDNFLRSYKNCIVNMDRIISITEDSFIIENGESISIPKRRLKEIKKYFEDYRTIN